MGVILFSTVNIWGDWIVAAPDGDELPLPEHITMTRCRTRMGDGSLISFALLTLPELVLMTLLILQTKVSEFKEHQEQPMEWETSYECLTHDYESTVVLF